MFEHLYCVTADEILRMVLMNVQHKLFSTLFMRCTYTKFELKYAVESENCIGKQFRCKTRASLALAFFCYREHAKSLPIRTPFFCSSSKVIQTKCKSNVAHSHRNAPQITESTWTNWHRQNDELDTFGEAVQSEIHSRFESGNIRLFFLAFFQCTNPYKCVWHSSSWFVRVLAVFQFVRATLILFT